MRTVPAWLGPVSVGAGGLLLSTVATVMVWPVTRHDGWFTDLSTHGIGALVTVMGTVVWLRGRGRVGKLITFIGITYYIQDLRVSDDAVVFAVGFCLAYLWYGGLAHLALALPNGELSGRIVRIVVAVSYFASVGTQVVRFVVDRPHPPWAYGIPQVNTFWAKFGSVVQGALAVVVIVLIIRNWLMSSKVRRRQSGASWGALVLIGGLVITRSTVSTMAAPFTVQLVAALAFSTTLVGLVVTTVFVRSAVGRSTHGKVANLLLELDVDAPPRSEAMRLRQALAKVLDDPSLTIHYPVADVPPASGTGRTTAYLQRHGELFAVIEYDEALREQDRAVRAAVAMAGLALENAHLYERSQQQLEQIRASRLRLAQASFEERRRIQRNLHDGAQQQMFAILVMLDEVRHHLRRPGATADAAVTVGRAHAELVRAIQTVRDLTRDIYPTDLVEHGLATAIEALADLAPLAVTVRVEPSRWPRHIEITAYFLIAEALVNVYKHAAADEAVVTAHQVRGELVVEVADDGRGGATMTGRGLSGLHDRVAAVGGALTIDSEAGDGTRLMARLPVGEP
jgi:signal transduction histidine kinase